MGNCVGHIFTCISVASQYEDPAARNDGTDSECVKETLRKDQQRDTASSVGQYAAAIVNLAESRLSRLRKVGHLTSKERTTVDDVLDASEGQLSLGLIDVHSATHMALRSKSGRRELATPQGSFSHWS